MHPQPPKCHCFSVIDVPVVSKDAFPLSFSYPFIVRECVSYLSAAMIKHHDQSNLQRDGVVWLTVPDTEESVMLGRATAGSRYVSNN